MAALLEYEFRTVGLDRLERDFRRVDRMADRSAKHQARTEAQTARRRDKDAARELKERAGAMAYVRRIRERQEAKETQARLRVLKVREQHEAKQRRTRQKAAREEQQRSARELRRREAAQIQHSRRSLARQKRDEIERSRLTDRHERQRSLARQRSVARRGDIAGRVASVGLGGLVAGGTAVAMATRREMEFDRQIRQLLVAGRGSGQKLAMDPTELGARVTQTSIRTGANREDLASALSAYVQRSGDLPGAIEKIETLATLSIATGTDLEALGSAAADFATGMRVEGDDFTRMFAKLAYQGKSGAFELSDMAAQMPALIAMAKSLNMSGLEGALELGGLVQIARSGTGSAPEAKTGTEAAVRQLLAKAGAMKSGEAFSGGRKLDVLNDDGTGLRKGLSDTLIDVVDTTGGRLPELQKIFGDEGMKLMRTVVGEYNRAGGGDSGTAALRSMFGKYTDVGGDWSDIETDAGIMQESSAVKWDQAMAKIQDILSNEKFSEAAVKLAEAAVTLAPAVAELAKWVARLADPMKEGDRDGATEAERMYESAAYMDDARRRIAAGGTAEQVGTAQAQATVASIGRRGTVLGSAAEEESAKADIESARIGIDADSYKRIMRGVIGDRWAEGKIGSGPVVAQDGFGTTGKMGDDIYGDVKMDPGPIAEAVAAAIARVRLEVKVSDRGMRPTSPSAG